MKSNRGLPGCISDLVVAVKIRGGDGNRAMLIFTGKTAFRGGGWNGMHVSGVVTKVLFKNMS